MSHKYISPTVNIQLQEDYANVLEWASALADNLTIYDVHVFVVW